MLAKMEVWFSSRNVQKAMAKTRPKYLARSPVSMRSAMKFVGRGSSSPVAVSGVIYSPLDCTVQSSQTVQFSLVGSQGFTDGANLRRQKAKAAAVPPPTKRESVIAAAAKLFLEEGYGATGMDTIA